MNKVVIIGDIHGCNTALNELLSKLPDDIDTIYSVGDLVDRGPDSKDVVQTCIDNDIKPVKGNHEDIFLDYLDETDIYPDGNFIMNGGHATLKSYGTTDPTKTCDIPSEHRLFLDSLPIYIETDEFIIIHAGVHPIYKDCWKDSNDSTIEADLMWNRDSIVNIGKPQIVGHTPVVDVVFGRDKSDNLIGINLDTGCGKGSYKPLSALVWPTLEVIQVTSYDT